MKTAHFTRMVFLLLCFVPAGTMQTEAVVLEHRDLFDQVIPFYYDSFVIEGSAADSALQMHLPLDAPEQTEFSVGLSGTYRQREQQQNYASGLQTGASFQAGTAVNRLQMFVDEASYRSYTLDAVGPRGFFQIEGRGSAELSKDPEFDTTITASLGTGRLHDISHIALAQLLLTYTHIVYGREDIIPAAELLARRNMRLNPMSDDDAKLHLEYYRDLAQALDMEDQTAEVILIDHNQAFAFERQRYRDLAYGSEFSAGLRISPAFRSDGSGFSLKAGPVIQAKLADLNSDSTWYVSLTGEISGGFASAEHSGFIGASVTGDIRHFPRNWRWRIDGSIEASAEYLEGFDSTFLTAAAVRYMIDPNFTVYGKSELTLGDTPAAAFESGLALRLW